MYMIVISLEICEYCSFSVNETFHFEGQLYQEGILTSLVPGTEKEPKCLFPSSFLGINKFNFTQWLLWEEVCRTWSYLTYLNPRSHFDRIDRITSCLLG